MKYFLFFIINLVVLFAEDLKEKPSLDKSVFSIKDNKVFIKKSVLPKADASTFRILDAMCHGDEDKYCFAADKNRIYYYSRELPDSDPQTFHFLDYGYSADKRNVYYIMDNVFRVVTGADSQTFQVVGYPEWANTSYAYGKDKNFAYYDGVRLKGSDGASFRLITKEGKYYARDKFQYYIGAERFPIKAKSKQ